MLHLEIIRQSHTHKHTSAMIDKICTIKGKQGQFSLIGPTQPMEVSITITVGSQELKEEDMTNIEGEGLTTNITVSVLSTSHGIDV